MKTARSKANARSRIAQKWARTSMTAFITVTITRRWGIIEVIGRVEAECLIGDIKAEGMADPEEDAVKDRNYEKRAGSAACDREAF